MSLFDWLATPAGIGLVQALTVLLLAVASYLSYLAHKSASRTESSVADLRDATASDKGVGGSSPPTTPPA